MVHVPVAVEPHAFVIMFPFLSAGSPLPPTAEGCQAEGGGRDVPGLPHGSHCFSHCVQVCYMFTNLLGLQLSTEVLLSHSFTVVSIPSSPALF